MLASSLPGICSVGLGPQRCITCVLLIAPASVSNNEVHAVCMQAHMTLYSERPGTCDMLHAWCMYGSGYMLSSYAEQRKTEYEHSNKLATKMSSLDECYCLLTCMHVFLCKAVLVCFN